MFEQEDPNFRCAHRTISCRARGPARRTTLGRPAHAGRLCRRWRRFGGCAVAARLSESGASVILLEAGPSDWYPMIHIPAGMRSLLRNPLVNWNYDRAGEGSGERRLDWPRGRTLGGSSSINGMLYVRGAGRLRRLGADGLPRLELRRRAAYFRKSEHYVQKGDPEVRGQGGPLKVEDYRTILPLTHRFVEAAQQAGFPFNPDLNGKQRYGVGYSQMTRRGRWRGSTAQTFLREARIVPTCGSRPTRKAAGSCSRASAAPASSSSAAAISPRYAPTAR